MRINRPPWRNESWRMKKIIMVRSDEWDKKNVQDPFSASGNSTLPSDNSVTESSHTKSLSCSPDELTTLKTAPIPAPNSSAITTHTQAVANTTTTNQAQSVTLTSEQNMLPTTTSCYPTHFKQGWAPYFSFKESKHLFTGSLIQLANGQMKKVEDLGAIFKSHLVSIQ